MKPIKLVMNAFGSFLEKTEIDLPVESIGQVGKNDNGGLLWI